MFASRVNISARFNHVNANNSCLQQLRNNASFRDFLKKGSSKKVQKKLNEFENSEDIAVNDKITHVPEFTSLADKRFVTTRFLSRIELKNP